MKILIGTTYKHDNKQNPPEEAKVTTSVKLFNVKKHQACYPYQDFEI